MNTDKENKEPCTHMESYASVEGKCLDCGEKLFPNQLEYLQGLVKEFLTILNEEETSDNGVDFHPTRIVSCRALHTKRLQEITSAMELATGFQKGVQQRDLINERVLIRENAIKLAEHHKEHCIGQECDISLYHLRRALELAGVPLNAMDWRKFM